MKGKILESKSPEFKLCFYLLFTMVINTFFMKVGKGSCTQISYPFQFLFLVYKNK